MSELFTYKGDDEHYFIKTKNKQYTGDEVADLLNFLSEENEQLKRQNKALKDSSLTDAYFDYLESSRTFTLKVVEDPIRVTKDEELFDDE